MATSTTTGKSSRSLSWQTWTAGAYWSLSIAGVIAAALLAFGGSWRHAITSWHDPAWVENLPPLTSHAPKQAWQLIWQPVDGQWSPVTRATFILNYWMAGNRASAAVCLGVNWLLHVACALALMAWLQDTFRNRAFSLAVALLFATLPAATDGVVWLAARGESLSLLGTLIALYSFGRFLEPDVYLHRDKHMAAAWLAAVMAMLSHRHAVFLPLYLLLYHLAFRSRGGDSLMSHARKVALQFHYHAPFVATALVAAWLHGHFSGDAAALAGAEGWMPGLARRLWIAVNLGTDYAAAFLAPQTLAPCATAISGGDLSGWEIAGMTGMILSCPLAFLLFRWHRLSFFLWGWVLLGLLSATGIRDGDPFMRHAYGMSVAYAAALGMLLNRLWIVSRAGAWIARPVAILALALTLVWNITWARAYAAHWQGDDTLYPAILEHQPRRVETRLALARLYQARQKSALARMQLELAVDLGAGSPALPEAVNALARLHLDQGNPVLALDTVSPLLDSPERDSISPLRLAHLYGTRADAEVALHLLESALADFQAAAAQAAQIADAGDRQRELKSALHRLAAMAASIHEINLAEESYRQAIELDPAGAFPPDTSVLIDELSRLLIETERLDSAVRLLEDALARDPHDTSLRVTLGEIQLGRGQIHTALATFNAAADAMPEKPEERLRMARLLIGRGALPEAEALVRAGFVDPGFVTIGNRFLYELHYQNALGLREQRPETPALLERIEQELRRAVELRISDLRADLLLAEMLARRDDFEAAEAVWRRMDPLLGEQPEWRMRKAMMYAAWGDQLLRRRDRQGAREKYERCLALQPGDGEARRIREILGDLMTRALLNEADLTLADAGEWIVQAALDDEPERGRHLTDARAKLDAVLADHPEHPGALFWLGRLHLEEGRVNEALACFRKSAAANADPVEQPDAWFWMGKTAYADGALDEAAAALTHYLNFTQWKTADSASAGILLREIARQFLADNVPEKAAGALETALGLAALDPQWQSIYYECGDAWKAAGRPATARRRLMRYQNVTGFAGALSGLAGTMISEIDTALNRAGAHLETARAELAQGEFAKAQAAIDAAAAEAADLPSVTETQGDYWRARDQLDKAEAAYRRAIEWNPFAGDVQSARLKLAALLIQKQDIEAARRALQMIVNARPDADGAAVDTSVLTEARRLLDTLPAK